MILILGASSYIGRHMLDSFGPSEVIATHKNAPLPGSVYFDSTQMRLADIVQAGSGISHAVILYAESRPDACKAEPERSRGLNVLSTMRVIDDLVGLGITPIFASSEYVFDGNTGSYIEEDTAEPNTVYGAQKLEVETYLAAKCHDYAVLRLAKVFSSDPGDGAILSGFLQQVRNGEEIRCARDQVFSPIHVDDVAAVTKAVVSLDLHGVYHVANPQPWSRLGMLRALLGDLETEANVVECSIRDFNFLDNRPLDLSMNPAKVLAATGLSFRTVESTCQELADLAKATENR